VAETKPRPLLAGPPVIVNVGLERFATELAGQGAKVVHVDWVPPARGNAKLAELLSRLARRQPLPDVEPLR
jgi:FdrA protein